MTPERLGEMTVKVRKAHNGTCPGRLVQVAAAAAPCATEFFWECSRCYGRVCVAVARENGPEHEKYNDISFGLLTVPRPVTLALLTELAAMGAASDSYD